MHQRLIRLVKQAALLMVLLPIGAMGQSATPSAAPAAKLPPLPPYMLVLSGRPDDVVDRETMMGVSQTWRRRLAARQVSPTQVGIEFVNLDSPKAADAIKRLGLKKGGVSMALAKTDGKILTEPLDVHGPYHPDTNKFMRNPEFGNMLDASNFTFGKLMQTLNRPWPWVGLSVMATDKLSAEEKAMYQVQQDGAMVFHVGNHSAAQKAGLREGDQITQINNTKIKSVADFQTAIASLEKVGNTVTLQVRRGGKPSTFTVTVTAYP